MIKSSGKGKDLKGIGSYDLENQTYNGKVSYKKVEGESQLFYNNQWMVTESKLR